MKQSFVDALNELMAGSGISNNELARRIDVDSAQVGRWRKGRGRPRPENLVSAAGVFGVDHRWLWALAYPEGVPTLDGPSDPRWAAFIAELETGWRSMDESTRALAERGARALFTIHPEPRRVQSGHRDGASIPHPGRRRNLNVRRGPMDDQGLDGSLPTVYASPRTLLASITGSVKRWLEPSTWPAAELAR